MQDISLANLERILEEKARTDGVALKPRARTCK